jgi:hypothetical protein
MRPVDLRIFSEHSQKVPSALLCHLRKVTPSWKILAAHLVDFWIVALGAGAITYSISSVYDLFFITSALKIAASADVEFKFFLFSFPFMTFNYFFFCYFLNHGQTCSMAILKSRIKLDSKEFGGALKWASRSTLLCFSCGLSFLIGSRYWKEVKEHDYLYGDLLTGLDETTIQLLSRVDARKSQTQDNSEHPKWREAA